MASKVEYRQMSDVELERCFAFAKCSLPTFTFARRFARQLRQQAESDSPKISERQAAQLAIQVYRYRRQIPGRLVPGTPPPGYMTPGMQRDFDRLRLIRAEYEKRVATVEPTIEVTKICGALEDAPRLEFAGVTA